MYNGDKLLGFGDKEIGNYDNFGNPKLYKGSVLQWEYGKRLTGYGNVAFKYDGCGRRIKKGNTSYSYLSD